MKLGQKVRYLRAVEGNLRGLGRPMTQVEVVGAMKRELRRQVSQSYLSQIENGSRPHLTHTTRTLLARFFKVHPGFLVDDPKGFGSNLESDQDTTEGKLDIWLLKGAERFVDDPQVSSALIRIAGQKESRDAVLLLGAILERAGLADRFRSVLESPWDESGPPSGPRAKSERIDKARTKGGLRRDR